MAFDENVLADGEDVQDVEVKLPDETFGNLVVEFRALGLITWSERKRSVSDRGSYWGLTPCGDDHLTTLRAPPQRRPPLRGSVLPTPSFRSRSTTT